MLEKLKSPAVIATACALTILVGTLAVFAASGDGGFLGWQTPDAHDEHQVEMNPQEADGPIVFQVRTETRGDVPILETSNQTYIQHQDEITELVNSGEWEQLEQYGSLTSEAQDIMEHEDLNEFIDREFPE